MPQKVKKRTLKAILKLLGLALELTVLSVQRGKQDNGVSRGVLGIGENNAAGDTSLGHGFFTLRGRSR